MPLPQRPPPVALRVGVRLCRPLVLTDGVEESGRGLKPDLRVKCRGHRGFNRCFSRSDTPDTLCISLNRPSRPSCLFIGYQVTPSCVSGATSRSPLEWTSLGIAQWSKLRRPFCTYEPTRLSFIPIGNKLSHTPRLFMCPRTTSHPKLLVQLFPGRKVGLVRFNAQSPVGPPAH